MASSFELGRRFYSCVLSGNPVAIQNFLMSSSSKDIALVCSLLSEEERNVILSRIAGIKRKDILDDLAYLKHVRVKPDQYSRVIEPMIANILSGRRGESTGKYFRPHPKGRD